MVVKRMSRKKPTIREIQKVVSSLIVEIQNLQKRMINIEFVFDNYFEYKKEHKKYKKYLEGVIDESKTRAGSDMADK